MHFSLKVKFILVGLIFGLLGIILGAYLFSDTQPRSFLTFHKCEEGTCFKSSELIGLLGSVGIQKLPVTLEPVVVLETDKTVVMKHPFPLAELHYVIIPKKDIKTAADVSVTDTEYLVDAYAVMADIIRDLNLVDYKIITNGPGFQAVNYLHFNIVADLDK